MKISSRDRVLVMDTYLKIARSEEHFTSRFYAYLFEMNPSYRKLFPSDMNQQGIKLRMMLNAIVRAMDNFEGLRSSLKALGKHHASYDVKRDYYPQFIEALIWALKEELHDDFTPQVEAAWRRILCVSMDYMVRDTY